MVELLLLLVVVSK